VFYCSRLALEFLLCDLSSGILPTTPLPTALVLVVEREASVQRWLRGEGEEQGEVEEEAGACILNIIHKPNWR
jgi:hypothetical protein